MCQEKPLKEEITIKSQDWKIREKGEIWSGTLESANEAEFLQLCKNNQDNGDLEICLCKDVFMNVFMYSSFTWIVKHKVLFNQYYFCKNLVKLHPHNGLNYRLYSDMQVDKSKKYSRAVVMALLVTALQILVILEVFQGWYKVRFSATSFWNGMYPMFHLYPIWKPNLTLHLTWHSTALEQASKATF